MTYQTRKENKLNRILRQNTKTQVRTTERAEKKAAKQPSPVILKNVSAVKLFVWLFGAMIIGIVALVLIGGGHGENQSTSTSTTPAVTSPAPTCTPGQRCSPATVSKITEEAMAKIK